MGTTTISLERSAYDLLRSRKRPNESFSDEIHRLIGSHPAEIKDFLTLISPQDGAQVADAIDTLRAQDLELNIAS
jgi:predicted CopG family antitoxin